MKYIDKILASKKTVFTYTDIMTLLSIGNRDSIKSFFARGVKQGVLKNIYKGIYVLNNYDIYEFSSKLKKNSYISFETVLKKEGIVFQDYGNVIFLASDESIAKDAIDRQFVCLKLKDSILLNPLGLINRGNYTIATTERAICDRIYLSPDYYFDNLDGVDIEKLQEIAKIYNKRVISEIDILIQNYA